MAITTSERQNGEEVIELPQEYINWLDEQQDLGILISLALDNFTDSIKRTDIPEAIRDELILQYGRYVIDREMGTPQK